MHSKQLQQRIILGFDDDDHYVALCNQAAFVVGFRSLEVPFDEMQKRRIGNWNERLRMKGKVISCLALKRRRKVKKNRS